MKLFWLLSLCFIYDELHLYSAFFIWTCSNQCALECLIYMRIIPLSLSDIVGYFWLDSKNNKAVGAQNYIVPLIGVKHGVLSSAQTSNFSLTSDKFIFSCARQTIFPWWSPYTHEQISLFKSWRDQLLNKASSLSRKTCQFLAVHTSK